MSDLSIKIAEPEINEDAPWADEKLGRKACADMLTSLLVGQTTALTVSVNGEWGSGKTFMLKRWQQQLTNEKYKAIYFNAWEDDFMGDPLVAIIGQLRKCLREDANLKGLAKGGAQSVWTLASGFTKKITGMDFEEAAVKSQKAAASKRDNILDDYDKLCSSRAELKTSLQKMAKQIFDTTQKPLVFIVDELDRCRPTFAIETLERIKHLFDIDHVVFVLGIDRKQLGESIKAIYGNIEIENYLHRFIDLDFQLPQDQGKKFIEVLWSRYGITPHLQQQVKSGGTNLALEEGGLFKNCFCELLIYHKFSLREIESAFRIFVMVQRATQPNQYTFPYFISLLILLKFKNNTLLVKLLHEKCSAKEIADFVMPKKTEDRYRDVTIMGAAIYTLFYTEYGRSNHTLEIADLLKAIKEEKSLVDNPYAPKYLLNGNPEDWKDFSRLHEYLTRYSGGRSAQYCKGVLPLIVNKIDMLLIGVDKDQ